MMNEIKTERESINPTYPVPGQDPTLDWMRAGLPDPGTPAARQWVDAHIIDPYEDWSGGDDDYADEDDCRTHPMSCDCEDCMQNYPERFDEEWENIYRVETEEGPRP